MLEDKRSFTNVNKPGSRYISADPSGAAKKAASKVFQSGKKGVLVIHLQETTAGSNKKHYKYEAKRVKNPSVVNRKNGEQTYYEFETQVKSLN